MIGWRARLGFLVPPGNPTVETEMIAMAPDGVSLHFHRTVAHGTPGSLSGQSERNRSMVEHIDNGIELLAMVKPEVIVIAHTATSYHLGRQGEAELLDRLEKVTGRRVVTAFGSVVRALQRLNIRKLALGTPYSAEVTLQGKSTSRSAWVRCREVRPFERHREHLRHNRRSRLRTGAVSRYRGCRSGVSQRHRNADGDGIGAARTGSRQACPLQRLGDDVACAAAGGCRWPDHRLRPPVDPQVRRSR